MTLLQMNPEIENPDVLTINDDDISMTLLHMSIRLTTEMSYQ